MIDQADSYSRPLQTKKNITLRQSQTKNESSVTNENFGKFLKITMGPDPFFSFPLFVLQYCVYTPKLFERGGFFKKNSMLYNEIF